MPSDPLLAQLMKLSVEEWRAIRDKANAYHLGAGAASPAPKAAKKPPKRTNPNSILLDGMIWELRRRAIISKKSNPAYSVEPKHVERIEAAWAQVLRQLPRRLTEVEKISLARVVAGAIANYLEGKNKTISVKQLTVNGDKAIPALDRAFPGYIGAGLLHFIVRDKNGGRGKGTTSTGTGSGAVGV